MMQDSYQFPGQQSVYHGKVRDVYTIQDKLVAIASDRISCFDHILPKPIPYKGQVLNQLAAYFLTHTQDVCPNWLEAVVHPNVSIGKLCTPIRIEMVVRGYLAGHAAREYRAGKRVLCGVSLPENLKENDRLPHPIITPAIKNLEGHDEDASRKEILNQAVVAPPLYEDMERYALALFARGTAMAASRGLILVDTKYEFGLWEGKVILIDEIHTPDSSRYFYREGYEDRQQKGAPQPQLSKEFVREWLIAHGFQGKEGQVMPEMPDDFVTHVSQRYIQLFEQLTGNTFVPEQGNQHSAIEKSILNFFRR
ncbi:MAG: phosphoribosylaminoimidazolesuccinocarboxamide synthase [Chitinophagales bacterium]